MRAKTLKNSMALRKKCKAINVPAFFCKISTSHVLRHRARFGQKDEADGIRHPSLVLAASAVQPNAHRLPCRLTSSIQEGDLPRRSARCGSLAPCSTTQSKEKPDGLMQHVARQTAADLSRQSLLATTNKISADASSLQRAGNYKFDPANSSRSLGDGCGNQGSTNAPIRRAQAERAPRQ